MQLYKDVTIRWGSWDFKKMPNKGFQEEMQTFSLLSENNKKNSYCRNMEMLLNRQMKRWQGPDP